MSVISHFICIFPFTRFQMLLLLAKLPGKNKGRGVILLLNLHCHTGPGHAAPCPRPPPPSPSRHSCSDSWPKHTLRILIRSRTLFYSPRKMDPCYQEGELSVRTKVTGLSGLNLSEAEFESPPFRFRHWEWKVGAQLYKGKLHVSLFRYGWKTDDVENWKALARVGVRILSQEEEGKVLWESDFEGSGHFTFIVEYNKENEDFIWNAGLSYKDLLNLGLVQDDSLLLEVQIRGNFPTGVGCAAEEKWRQILEREALGPASEGFLSLLEAGEDADLALIPWEGESEKIQAHRLVLKARSPVFRAMFQTDMLERRTARVELPDISGRSLKAFVRFLYSGGVEDGLLWAEGEELEELLGAGEKYGLGGLKELSALGLVIRLVPENAIRTLLLVEAFGLPEMEGVVLSYIQARRNFSRVMGN